MTWSGSVTLEANQVVVAYSEVNVVSPSTVGFSLTVDDPPINLFFTWDGQEFTNSSSLLDQVVGVQLVNMTLPGHNCCEVYVKYFSDVPTTSTATWSIVSGDGILEHPSLTIE